jgi:hypothetical protein
LQTPTKNIITQPNKMQHLFTNDVEHCSRC